MKKNQEKKQDENPETMCSKENASSDKYKAHKTAHFRSIKALFLLTFKCYSSKIINSILEK